MIEKAPLLFVVIETDNTPRQTQRDADHEYYLKEFTKWLKTHCTQRYEREWVDDDFVAVDYMQMKLADYESLVKEAETDEQPRQVE